MDQFAATVNFTLERGLTGKVEAKYPSLEPGELQTCTDTITNSLDKTLYLIELRQQLFNLDTNTEIDTDSENQASIWLDELESGVSFEQTRYISTDNLEPGNYACKLQASLVEIWDFFDIGMAPFTIAENTPEPSSCYLYAVHDQGTADSQLLRITTENFAIETLGALHPKYNIEAIDLHPKTQQLFASAAYNGNTASELFLVNTETGELTSIGKIRNSQGKGFKKVSALSFHPDGSLWGYANRGHKSRRGILRIDPETAIATLEKQSKRTPIEALAWTIDGSVLWLAKRSKKLYTWKPGKSIKKKYRISKLPGPIEGLEFRPDGLLMLGIHHRNTHNIISFDTVSGTILDGESINTGNYNDIESIAWPESCDTIKKAELTLNKTGPKVAEFGEEILYQFEVKNTGQISLNNLNINDPLLGGDLFECEFFSLEPGESYNCSANYIIDSNDPLQLTNTATVNAETSTGIPITANDSHKLSIYTDIPQPQCLFYAVHDKNRNNSQFISLSQNGQIKRLGPEYSNADIEGLDINPFSGAIIVSSGKDGQSASELFQLNPETGELITIGTIQDEQGNVFKEVASLAFHQNGTLWGFAKKGELRGIIQINQETAKANLEFPSKIKAEGIAWLDNTLWLIAGKKLYKYSPYINKIEKVQTLSLPKSVESLFFTPNGLLITAVHKNGKLRLMSFNPETGKFRGELRFKTHKYYDIEGLSWPQWCGEPETPHCP